MKEWIAGFACALLLTVNMAVANEEPPGNEAGQLRGIVKNLLDDNTAFTKSRKADDYKMFAEKQHPRATVVTCSDSHVHTLALDNASTEKKAATH